MSEPDDVRSVAGRGIPCPLCGGDDPSRRALQEPPLLQCRRCRLVYRVTPVRPVFTGKRDAAELRAVAASRARLFESRLRRLGPASGSFLVDIGCGSGSFLQLARAAGWTAVGLELDASLARRARSGGQRVAVADAEHAPLRSASARAVTLWDVLDHFETPQRAVAEAARVLRPGGFLYLRVRHGTVHEMMRRQRWLPRGLSVLHNNMFSPRCLQLALDNAGFEDVRVTPSPTSHGDPYASGGLWLRTVKRGWDVLACATARLTAGRVIVSPSISVQATRAHHAASGHA